MLFFCFLPFSPCVFASKQFAQIHILFILSSMFEFLALCLVLTVLETHAGKISPGVKFTVISIFFFSICFVLLFFLVSWVCLDTNISQFLAVKTFLRLFFLIC